MKEKKPQKGNEWLKKEMRPYHGKIYLIAFLSVVSVLLSLAFSFLIKDVVNNAADGKRKLMIVFSAVILVLAILRVLTRTFVSYYSERCRAKITVGLRSRLFDGILRSEYAQTEKYHSGDLLTRMTSDVSEVAADSVSIFPAVASMVVQCVGAISALLLLDPLFTGIFTLGGALCGGAFALFRKKVKKYHKEMIEQDGKSRSFIQESITSLITLKAYGAEEKTSEKARDILQGYYIGRMKKNRLQVAMNCAFGFLSNAGTVFALLWCSARIMMGKGGDFGSILSVITLLSQLQQPFASFSAVLPVYYARSASAERLAELDDLPEENSTPSDTAILYKKMQSLKIEKLSFTYGRKPVFIDADAETLKGGIVCITGVSGTGKSTLFKLLLNVYSPTSGGIYADFGKDRLQIASSQRGLFAYVPQGNFLFSGSIYENLTFFTGDVPEDRIKAALIVACAQFVFDLPQGLQTSLKERGGGLSEGQLQRLAIARAILSDRPVLLLDEATSALDETTEKEVLENIREKKDKTCLIVTHRPAALTIADRVWKIENGQILVL